MVDLKNRPMTRDTPIELITNIYVKAATNGKANPNPVLARHHLAQYTKPGRSYSLSSSPSIYSRASTSCSTMSRSNSNAFSRSNSHAFSSNSQNSSNNLLYHRTTLPSFSRRNTPAHVRMMKTTQE